MKVHNMTQTEEYKANKKIAYNHTSIQTYKHTNIQAYNLTSIQTYKNKSIQTYNHTSIQIKTNKEQQKRCRNPKDNNYKGTVKPKRQQLQGNSKANILCSPTSSFDCLLRSRICLEALCHSDIVS